MKFFYIIILLIPFFSAAQEAKQYSDSSTFVITSKDDYNVLYDFSDNKVKEKIGNLKSGVRLPVYDIIEQDGMKYFTGYYNTRPIAIDYVTDTENGMYTMDLWAKVYLISHKAVGTIVRKRICILADSLLYLKNLIAAAKSTEVYKKNGFVINEWHLTTGTTDNSFGLTFSFTNYTESKTIKYAWFTVQPYNRVDDKVGIAKTFSAIGPIKFSETNEAVFDDAFYSTAINYAKITKVKLQFTDGSFKEYLSVNKILAD